MTDREYPRWIHREGRPKDSVVAETAEEEAAILARWKAADLEASRPNQLTGLTKPPVAPKGKGGWPKGKPRTSRNVAVN